MKPARLGAIGVANGHTDRSQDIGGVKRLLDIAECSGRRLIYLIGIGGDKNDRRAESAGQTPRDRRPGQPVAQVEIDQRNLRPAADLISAKLVGHDADNLMPGAGDNPFKIERDQVFVLNYQHTANRIRALHHGQAACA